MAEEDKTVVEFKADANDAETGDVKIHSPAKNRHKGTALTPDDPQDKPCNRRRPILFDRAAKSWWNPKFDSNILESGHQKISFPQTKKRFQLALVYIILSCLAWGLFFALTRDDNWVSYMVGCAVLLVCTTVVLAFSYTQKYEQFMWPTSVLLTLLLCIFCLLSFVYSDDEHPSMSAVGTFAGSIEILLMMYTLIPLPLYLCTTMGILYSVVYELLSGLRMMSNPHYIIGRCLLHVCIHLIGIHIFITAQVRKRSTFLKVGQSIMSRQELAFEKKLMQKMIHSLMPPTVAQEIIKQREGDNTEGDENNRQHRRSSSGPVNSGKMTFRMFHMSKMDNVSILFADIVGFTKMSSNKTAEHLVSLLNDLFGRFDIICKKSGCEKISTLGDCYYCVSGCPEEKADHARCCVEMGLEMCVAIQDFDRDHNEAVNMRVGVHTGTVLCGLVGTRRFKFDVWSHDVTLANTMESDGEPGKVHISDCTYKFIKDEYDVVPGKPVEDIRMHKVLIEDYNMETQQYTIRHIQDKGDIDTWFITGRKAVFPLASPGGKEDVPSSPKADAAGPEAVNVAVEERVDDQQASPEDVTISLPIDNHLETQPDANGLSPAALLGHRENISASLENVGAPAGDPAATALMEELKQKRKQSDQQLMVFMEEDQGVLDYLYRPPINQCTLSFKSSRLETEYRDRYIQEKMKSAVPTLAQPQFSAISDLVTSLIFYTLISACCFLGFAVRVPWILFCILGFAIELIMLLPLLVDLSVANNSLACIGKFLGWYPRHVLGAVLACLPPVAVYTNFSCDNDTDSDLFYCMVLVASLLHFCNFTMLSSWMKSSLATVAGMVLLILLAIGVCSLGGSTADTATAIVNSTLATVDYDVTVSDNFSLVVGNKTTTIFEGESPLRYEIILNMLLLLLLIWFLNREFEINYRLSFHGDQQAAKDRIKMQQEKDQADWLLHNIIPEHVSDVLKVDSKYCKNHKEVGVIFAKVTNFDDFYDESFKGGREYLRVLNELMGDFEDLFDDPKYKDVEKIKTIGSCLMAASGLNPGTRNQNKNPNAHLYQLIDFAQDLLGKLDQFNSEIFNFDFEMTIGFSFGAVTAGVIGTTKLLYDIWGDTVNIASRMYSTGEPGRIQVTDYAKDKLEDMFEFQYRGMRFVKGKGDMKTYLLVKKKEGATWE